LRETPRSASASPLLPTFYGEKRLVAYLHIVSRSIEPSISLRVETAGANWLWKLWFKTCDMDFGSCARIPDSP
jgi:hypothetical protein